MMETIQLSTKEWSLLQALNKGASNKDLAEAFNKSEYTIRNQLSSLYKKIKVTNRVHAIFWYRALELQSVKVQGTQFIDRRQGPANDRRKASPTMNA